MPTDAATPARRELVGGGAIERCDIGARIGAKVRQQPGRRPTTAAATAPAGPAPTPVASPSTGIGAEGGLGHRQAPHGPDSPEAAHATGAAVGAVPADTSMKDVALNHGHRRMRLHPHDHGNGEGAPTPGAAAPCGPTTTPGARSATRSTEVVTAGAGGSGHRVEARAGATAPPSRPIAAVAAVAARPRVPVAPLVQGPSEVGAACTPAAMGPNAPVHPGGAVVRQADLEPTLTAFAAVAPAVVRRSPSPAALGSGARRARPLRRRERVARLLAA